MTLNYFDEQSVYARLQAMTDFEGKVIQNLPLKPALH